MNVSFCFRDILCELSFLPNVVSILHHGIIYCKLWLRTRRWTLNMGRNFKSNYSNFSTWNRSLSRGRLASLSDFISFLPQGPMEYGSKYRAKKQKCSVEIFFQPFPQNHTQKPFIDDTKRVIVSCLLWGKPPAFSDLSSLENIKTALRNVINKMSIFFYLKNPAS